MTLIKCPECGKKYSDKASSCPQCACPTSVIENEDAVEEKVDIDTRSEKEIIRSVNDTVNLFYELIVCDVFYVIVTIQVFFLHPVFFWLMFLVNLFCVIYYTSITKKEYIVITNKRVYGVKRGFLTEAQIDFPLSQVSTVTFKSVLGYKSVILESTGGSKVAFEYVANAEELSNTFANMKK